LGRPIGRSPATARSNARRACVVFKMLLLIVLRQYPAANWPDCSTS
jgi:hypothetical protein